MRTDTTGAVAGEPVREGVYGDRVTAVEPGGVEFIPASDRHGTSLQMLWTWMSPNLEFATVFVGILGVGIFGLSFWQAVLALLIGNALGSLSHAVLSARGPKHGVPQMVLSRTGFGFWGNALPAGLNSITAGIGWFAVNSVSGAFALAALTGMPALLGLLIVVVVQVVVAFFGHNLVQAFEKYALVFLGIVFVLAAIWLFTKSHAGAPAHAAPGGFLLTTGAAFGYAAGWNPYAADYTRYLPAGVSAKMTGLWAGLGVFVSCMLLEIVGAASVAPLGALTEANPTSSFTDQLPGWLGDLTLLAIALGAVSANVLNIYSGAMSFLTLGVRLPLALRRALVAVVFGVIGFLLAWSGLHDAGGKYENFLLIIAYWIGPWLGVMFTDQYLRRGKPIDKLLYAKWYQNWAGPIAMAVGIVVSILLFSNQTDFTGFVARQVPGLGDIAFLVGFVLSVVVYAGLRPYLGANRTTPPSGVQES
ncbi:MAG TPA: cytosine permease [Pseudonocardiaceae bacterium]|nr:cytosine permease [Pseudonocardiaceae bacterium]